MLLRGVMGLLAIAMEIGAGVALYEARRLGSEGEDPMKLADELKTLREKIASRQSELAQLRKEPAVFANRFWRDFHRGMLNGAVLGVDGAGKETGLLANPERLLDRVFQEIRCDAQELFCPARAATPWELTSKR